MPVCFTRKYPWALLPFKQTVPTSDVKNVADLYAKHFRWLRAYRTPEQCWPWRLGQELGWIIPSSVDVALGPLDDHEVAGEYSDEDLITLSKATGWTELWKRDRSSIGFSKAGWIRLYDFRVEESWQSMFIPNGQGTVEWKLGWRLELEGDYVAIVFPLQTVTNVEVPIGVFTPKVIARLNAQHGMSIAIHPLNPVVIKRGDPLAKLVICHSDVLTLKTESPED